MSQPLIFFVHLIFEMLTIFEMHLKNEMLLKFDNRLLIYLYLICAENE